MKLEFHPDTLKELKKSKEWYQSQADGLGDTFIQEIELALHSIKSLPNT